MSKRFSEEPCGARARSVACACAHIEHEQRRKFGISCMLCPRSPAYRGEVMW